VLQRIRILFIGQ